MVFYCQNLFAKQSQTLKSNLTWTAVRAKNEIERTRLHCLKRATDLIITAVEVCAGRCFGTQILSKSPGSEQTVHLEHVLPMYGDICQL